MLTNLLSGVALPIVAKTTTVKDGKKTTSARTVRQITWAQALQQLLCYERRSWSLISENKEPTTLEHLADLWVIIWLSFSVLKFRVPSRRTEIHID